MLHGSTFDYLKPSNEQIDIMDRLRKAARQYALILEHELPDGADKTHLLRKLREVAMWANIAATRNADGSPIVEQEDE
jgi:hypothetical protein